MSFFACCFEFYFLSKGHPFAKPIALHSGKFWRFSKPCHFSNVRCFLKPFFPQTNCNEVLVSFFACFLEF